jgi:two-component system chemotaxis response regulator CheY
MAEDTEKKEKDGVPEKGNTGMTVFLVDDDKFLLDMYSVKFKKAGVTVDVASSSLEALKKIREGFSPEVILLDIIMPGMDGLELLGTIRKERLALKSKIIILTNQADDNEKAKKIGIDGFIVKAMSIPSEVVNQVMEIYNKK